MILTNSPSVLEEDLWGCFFFFYFFEPFQIATVDSSTFCLQQTYLLKITQNFAPNKKIRLWSVSSGTLLSATQVTMRIICRFVRARCKWVVDRRKSPPWLGRWDVHVVGSHVWTAHSSAASSWKRGGAGVNLAAVNLHGQVTSQVGVNTRHCCP